MSWRVQNLLLERESLRARSENSATALEDDDFLDLLLVERKIQDFYRLGLISDFELSIMNYVITNKSYSTLEELLGITRQTISSYFTKMCNKIGYALGGEFTDAGYIEYMRNKYKLDDGQVDLMIGHMNSRYKHTTRRKEYNDLEMYPQTY